MYIKNWETEFRKFCISLLSIECSLLSGQMSVHWLRNMQTIYSVNEVVSRKKNIWKIQYIRTIVANLQCSLVEERGMLLVTVRGLQGRVENDPTHI